MPPSSVVVRLDFLLPLAGMEELQNKRWCSGETHVRL